jgi:hypothetical protein
MIISLIVKRGLACKTCALLYILPQPPGRQADSPPTPGAQFGDGADKFEFDKLCVQHYT